MVSCGSTDQPQSLIWPTCNPVSNSEPGIFLLPEEYIFMYMYVSEENTRFFNVFQEYLEGSHVKYYYTF